MALSNPKFEDSYARLFGPNVAVDGAADDFFAEFYRRFLEAPGIGQMFERTDMRRQIRMLRRSLFQVVSFYVTGVPSAELERIADVHVRLGVGPEMFDDWLEALVATVAACDSHADEATLLAWCWALAPGMTYMRLRLLEG